jgi:hypothetical protein
MVWTRSIDPWQGFIEVIKGAEESINRVVPCPRDMRLSSLLTTVMYGSCGGGNSPRPVNARDLSQTNGGASWVDSHNESYDIESNTFDTTLNQTRQSNSTVESQNPLAKRDFLATPRKGVLRTPASSKSVLAEIQSNDSASRKSTIHRRAPFVAANHKTLTPQEVKARLAAQREQGALACVRARPLLLTHPAARAQKRRIGSGRRSSPAPSLVPT